MFLINLEDAFVAPSHLTFVYATIVVGALFWKLFMYTACLTYYLILISIVAISIFLIVLKRKIEKQDLRNGTDKKVIIKRDIINGSKSVEYIFRAPIIVLPLLGPNSLISIYIWYVASISGAIISAMFILPKVLLCRLHGSMEYDNKFRIVIFFNVFLILPVAVITSLYELRTHKEILHIWYFQTILAVLSIPLMTIKLFVEQNELELLEEIETLEKERKDEEEKQLLEEMMSDSDSSEDEEDYNSLMETECKVCYVQYSTKLKKRTPRILKECGHTVCGGCANNLLAGNDGAYIDCPFCQKATFVDGSARKLPKNFALIAVLEELGKNGK
ncbi:hypothetical protein CAEBREN_21360 [Caenorhabditis brenneri]|uniref:RING-type domain-containing protein n=1 Tax=Caenorhabditis brenneri TaxID=135651 RepID=G0M9Z2_CAEBE|nr:hypothetical protein CAEBREN_21360 [Caenorhabditis brenneri]